MRVALAILLAMISGIDPQTSEKNQSVPRYGIDLNARAFPQATPKEALGSVLKAIGEKQFDYLLAQLTEPEFVDKQVSAIAAKQGSGAKVSEKMALAFREMVQKITDGFKNDPSKLAELQRFYQEGEWQEDGNDAVGTLKGVQARKVFMKRIAPDRWALVNREK